MARLIESPWPDHGPPALPPPVTPDELRGRLGALREAAGPATVVVYGDREHAANLHWLLGFDPRFEEALLVLSQGGAALLVGNECLPYAEVSPAVAAGDVRAVHVPTLSLPSQPRRGLSLPDAVRAHVPEGPVTAIGWKPFGEGEAGEGASTLPGFVLDLLRARGPVEDRTGLLMDPGTGLRATVTAEEVARLEFAQAMAARAARRLVMGLREGMTDFEAVEEARIGGLPPSAHVTLATGARAFQGMSSPTGERVRLGSPLSFNVAHWGSNTCRAGWVARDDDDLPGAARGYLAAFAGPYLEAMSAWCALMVPGTPGGLVWERMMALLPFETFGVTLNPGHLIGTDEWLSSPIFEGSDLPIRSGMAMQMDVIPSHPAYGSTRLEDGYVVADEGLRADLGRRFPEVLGRCERRAAWMREVVGLAVPATLLPLADTCGVLPPFLLAPRSLLALRR